MLCLTSQLPIAVCECLIRMIAKFQKAKRGESKECKENKEKEILKMQKWTKGTDIFDKAYLFVPVHDK